METKDVVAVEEAISTIVGSPCSIEYFRYISQTRAEVFVGNNSDGLVKDNLGKFRNYYHHDFCICVNYDDNNFGKYQIAKMRLYQLPGCCGVAVSSDVYVAERYRNQGINNLLHTFRINLAKYMGFGTLMCTYTHRQEAVKRTLVKNNWKELYTFINPRTNNTVHMSIIDLK